MQARVHALDDAGAVSSRRWKQQQKQKNRASASEAAGSIAAQDEQRGGDSGHICQLVSSTAGPEKQAGCSSAGTMSDEGDPFFFEYLLNSVSLVPLLDAARELDGVEFLHGTRQQMMQFSFVKGEPALRACLEWAATCDLEDVQKALGEQQLAAIRAWTCTPLCYILCFLLRSPSRSRASVKPVLPYARLMFEGLHALPERYIFQDGTLYRAETGAMKTWDSKMYPGGSFGFYAPTSFSRDPAVLKNFKEEEVRTVFILHGASGWILDDFSGYTEQEVLVESVCFVEVIAAEKFDASHRDVLMGEIKQGLHRVEGRVRPGVELLEGSQVKKYEAESYRKWQET